jgi:non-heme chloroperoxidase
MGCAVAWAYWELFGGDRLSRLVLIDQPAVAVSHPHWPDGLGAASLFPTAAAKYVAANIPSSSLRILSADQRGSHLSFLENPSPGQR